MKVLRLAKLGGLRVSSLALMLVQNVLIVKFLSLEQIGAYYVIGTIAYLGNAVVFVGADLGLQRQLSRLSVQRTLCRRGLATYLAATGAGGAALVLGVAAAYFLATGYDQWATATALCVLLALSTYASNLGRNLCQLAGFQNAASLGPIVDGLVRCIAVAVLLQDRNAGALLAISAGVLSALCSASVTLALLLRGCTDCEASYLVERRRLVGHIAHVGGSGITNWLQLQAWRPLVASRPGGAQVVGSVSFLMTLGSTAAGAVFNVMALLQMPHLYSSRGATSGRYLRQLVVVTLVLAVASLPFGWVFLQAVGRPELHGLVWLVAAGVLVEAGNAVVGVCTNHLNVCERSLRSLWKAGVAGCALTFVLIFFPLVGQETAVQLAVALLAGQLCTVLLVLFATFAVPDETAHAQH